MSQILQPFQLPLVNVDVNSSDIYLDIFHSLDVLTNTIDDVFNRMEKRISDERLRVIAINDRVRDCEHKVNQVRGSNKATTVFSTSKFPGAKSLPVYPSLFNQAREIRPPFREISDDLEYTLPNPKKAILADSDRLDEVFTILSRLNVHGSDMERVEFVMEEKGLGPPPSSLSSVGSLLLFNSSINPYKDYQALDNLLSAGKSRAEEDEAKSGLALAPKSVLSGDALPDISQFDLTFKPEMGEMASLALPTNLPLDFLADISFTGVSLPSIAPSAHLKANYALPQLTYDTGPSAKEARGSGPPPPPPPSSSGPPPPPPPSSSSMPPPPPPPPTTSSLPPPPPPPTSSSLPPPPPPSSSSESVPVSPLPTPTPMAGGGGGVGGGDEAEDGAAPAAGGRSSLLDSIKLGKKLKSKDEQTASKSSGKALKEEKKPLSMADDLRARLARRNNAISGKSDQEQAKKDAALVKAAQNKPPPTLTLPTLKKTNTNSSSSNSSSTTTTTTASNKPSTSSSLSKFGFAKVEDVDGEGDGESSDEDEPKPRFSIAPARMAEDQGQDSDSDSDMSEVSVDSVKASRVPTFSKPPVQTPAAPVPAPAPTPAPVSSAPPPSAPPGGGRRGSLLDTSNATVSSMLNAAKAKDVSDGEDDWD